jgi:N-acetylglucosaminyl-diphospho-decaprenol L-rhamnosyltransferase
VLCERAVRDEPRISAIVVTYFSGDILRLCLTNLLASPACDEIILVNNGNPDEVVAELRAWTEAEPRLKLLTGHGNVGFGRACNLGAKHATSPILAFVNPDCVVELGALAQMALLADAPNPVLVGGCICDPHGLEQRGARRGTLSVWSACVSFSGAGRPGEQAGIWRDFNRNREPLPTSPIETPVVSGALMVTRADAFWQIGGFDEAYFLHVEDIDLCHRYGLGGGKVIFDPSARATHIGGTSQTASWRVETAKLRSFLYYFWKFARPPFGHIGVILVAPVLALAILMRVIAVK